jgi:hypothetical protein
LTGAGDGGQMSEGQFLGQMKYWGAFSISAFSYRILVPYQKRCFNAPCQIGNEIPLCSKQNRHIMNLSVKEIIWMACLGFVFTTFAFIWPYFFKGGSNLRQVRFAFREKLDSLLEKREKRLYFAFVNIDSSLKLAAKNKETEKAKELAAQLPTLRTQLENTIKERMQNDSLNTDSILRYHLAYLYINADTLYNKLQKRQSDSLIAKQGQWPSDSASFFLPALIRDTVLLPGDTCNQPRTVNIRGWYQQENSMFTFFSKNPSFALWLLLTLIQGVIWLVAITMISQQNPQQPNINPNPILDKLRQALGFLKSHDFILSALVTTLFCICVYWIIVDTYSLPDHLFINQFNNRVFLYAIPGYLAATLCFTACLRILAPLQKVNTLNISNQQLSSPELETKQKQLKAFLTLSVIILCFFVFWLSSLFNSINSLHTLKTYTIVARSPFLPYDFVYLMGLAHSMLLGMFYIPVQLKVRQMRLAAENAAPEAVRDQQKVQWWKKVLPNIVELLVPVAPFLTAIIKGLLDAFTG